MKAHSNGTVVLSPASIPAPKSFARSARPAGGAATRALFASTWVLGAMAVAGCGGQSATLPPLQTTDVAQEASQHSAALLDGAGAALESLFGQAAVQDAVAQRVDGATRDAMANLVVPLAKRADRQQMLDSMRRRLSERIFVEKRVESRTDTTILFRLFGKDVCPDESSIRTLLCAAIVDQLELRVAVKRTAPGALELRLLVGQAQRSPATVDLSGDTSLAMTVDLGEARAAAADYLGGSRENSSLNTAALTSNPANAAPHDDAGAAWLPSMRGVVSFRVERKGETKFALSLHVVEEVAIAAAGGAPGRFRMEASSPTLAATVDSASARVLAQVQFCALDYTADAAKWALLSDAKPGVPLHLHLGSVSFSAAFAMDHHEAYFSNISFGGGDSFVAVGGVPFLRFDGGSAGTSPFSVMVAGGVDGRHTVRVAPAMQLQWWADVGVLLPYAPLLRGKSQAAIDAFRDETFRVAVTGNAGATLVTPPAPRHAMKVLDGVVTIEATRAHVKLEAVAGQCVVPATPTSDAQAELRHPLLRHVAVSDVCE